MSAGNPRLQKSIVTYPKAVKASAGEVCLVHDKGARFPRVVCRPFQFFDIRTAWDDMIVQPLMIYVMMEKKYQLVAWTRNVGKGEVEVRMIPQLHHQTQEHLFDGIAECNRKGNSGLARKIHLLEQSADFNLMTGHYGEGLRFLRAAALACLNSDEKWIVKREFQRLYDKFHEMIRKYGREDILIEMKSKLLKEHHLEHTK